MVFVFILEFSHHFSPCILVHGYSHGTSLGKERKGKRNEAERLSYPIISLASNLILILVLSLPVTSTKLEEKEIILCPDGFDHLRFSHLTKTP